METYFTQDDECLKWEEKECTKLLSTVVFDVTSQKCCSRQNVEGQYIICDAKDWVAVIAEHDDKFLMVKQWRHGEKALSVEFPGGVIEKNEEPIEAARRELKEETGAVAGKMIFLGKVNPNPALFSNHFHVFLAQDLQFTGSQNLDHDEFINCIQIDKKDVVEAMGSSEFPHALMASALFLYMKHKMI